MIAEKLELFGNVGTLLLHSNNLNREAATMEKLGDLEMMLSRMVEMMAWQFDDLEAFMDDQVLAEISQAVSTLFRVLIHRLRFILDDAIQNPFENNIEIFRDTAQRTPPLYYAKKFISIFVDDATNPMILAMKADRYRTDATFQRWRSIVDGVLSQLLILETFINSMFWDKNMHGPNELKANIYGIQNRMDWLRDHYKNTYWPTIVSNIVHDVQENGGIRGNDNKALEIKKHLTSILNDHSFYIIVYNECDTHANHSFHGNPHQFMCSFGRGGCNVVIYRSLYFLKCEASAHEQMKLEVESCRTDTIPALDSYEKYPQKLRKERIENTGFVGMINESLNVAVKFANLNRGETGPGWCVIAKSGYFGSLEHGYRKEFILVAGFQ